MFYHCVHFWLHDHVTDDQRQQLIEGLNGLQQSPNVQSARAGVPAGTDRAVVDNAWDVQLIAVFADKAAHDRYQSDEDDVHREFIENFKSYWHKVLIYDSLQAS